MKTKKFWKRGWYPILLGGALALPLPLAIACTNTVADRITRVDYNPIPDNVETPGNVPSAYANMKLNAQWPFSNLTLNSIAGQLSTDQYRVKENDTPWRGGVAYESITQTVSLLRGLATSLGWNQIEQQKELNTDSRNENFAYLTDEDVAQNKSNAQIRAEYSSNISNEYLNSARTWGAAPSPDSWADSYEHKLASQLYFGDSDIDPDSSLFDFSYVTHPSLPANTVATSNTFPALTNRDIRLYAWNDHVQPGLLKVVVSGVNYDVNASTRSLGSLARVISLPNRALIYPVIERVVFTAEFAPVLQQALLRFLELFDDQTIEFLKINPVLKLTPDLIYMVQYLKANFTKLTSERQLLEFEKLNNGTHHMLATIAFWKGFDSSFTKEDSEIADFAATKPRTERPSETLPQWNFGAPLPGLRSQAARGLTTGSLQLFLRQIQVQVYKQQDITTENHPQGPGFFQVRWSRFPERGGSRAAFFTNRTTLEQMVEANQAVLTRW